MRKTLSPLLLLNLVLNGCASMEKREKRIEASEQALKQSMTVYFNCLGEAAKKYIKSSESADTIADAAHGKCAHYYNEMELAIIEDLNSRTSEDNRINNLNNGRLMAVETKQEFHYKVKQLVLDMRLGQNN